MCNLESTLHPFLPLSARTPTRSRPDAPFEMSALLHVSFASGDRFSAGISSFIYLSGSEAASIFSLPIFPSVIPPLLTQVQPAERLWERDRNQIGKDRESDGKRNHISTLTNCSPVRSSSYKQFSLAATLSAHITNTNTHTDIHDEGRHTNALAITLRSPW